MVSTLESASIDIEHQSDGVTIACLGNWTLSGIAEVDRKLRHFESALGISNQAPRIDIDTSMVNKFDTSGAWVVARLRRACEANNIAFSHLDGPTKHRELVEVVNFERAPDEQVSRSAMAVLTDPIDRIGRFSVGLWRDFMMVCNMIGAIIRGPQLKAVRKRGIRPISIIHQLDQMALRAIPVIAVMSFLIGAIIAQQGAFQLKFYGEELLTVNLVGILLLREIGVLLTAVMMAGRTGSAITAEIGTMKMREEIDALRVMGLNPVAVLVFPRLVALVIAMPILTLLADLAGIFGAIVVTWLYVGITPEQFITALREAIDLSTLLSGLIKAPFMAVIIALIAAIEGMKVSGSAESLGRHTTNAVVRSIFAVILLDGFFAIFYATIGY